jgi:hypothetical protein
VSKMRQFGTVRKLPSGRFQCRYWHLGEQVAAPTTFTTKADANAWLAAVETDIRRGEHVDTRPVRSASAPTRSSGSTCGASSRARGRPTTRS